MTDHAPADILDRLASIAHGTALDALRRQRPRRREIMCRRATRPCSAPRSRPGSLRRKGWPWRPSSRSSMRTPLPPNTTSPCCASSQAAPSSRRRCAGSRSGRGPRAPMASTRRARSPAEDRAGPELAVDAAERERLGARLAAALAHAHRLVFHPRDAQAQHLATLRGPDGTPTRSSLSRRSWPISPSRSAPPMGFASWARAPEPRSIS